GALARAVRTRAVDCARTRLREHDAAGRLVRRPRPARRGSQVCVRVPYGLHGGAVRGRHPLDTSPRGERARRREGTKYADLSVYDTIIQPRNRLRQTRNTAAPGRVAGADRVARFGDSAVPRRRRFAEGGCVVPGSWRDG